MAKWLDEGESNLLDVYLKGASYFSTLYLGLYSNSSEPIDNTTLAGLTELSGNGYGRISLAAADWTIAGSVPTSATNVEKTFNCSGGDWGTVTGYFICTASAGTVGKLICLENFPNGPFSIVNGGQVKVTPKISCD